MSKEIKLKVLDKFLCNFFKIKKKHLSKINYNKSDFWDSLSHMNLIGEIEKRYKVKLGYKEMINMTNYKNIIQILKKLKK
jgi:acyl carrier protein